MLTTLSTVLARAHRKKGVVLSCQVTHPDIASAAIRTAEALQKSLILTVDTPHVTAYQAEVLLHVGLELANHSQEAVAVEVRTTSDIDQIHAYFDCGALAISPDYMGTGKDYAALLKKSMSRAVSHGAETVAHIPHTLTIAQAEKLVNDSGVQAVRVEQRADSNQLHELIRALKVPAILEPHIAKPAEMKRLIRSGIAGLTLAEELDEAYTAGLYTGLRGRNTTNPSLYTQLAMRAVEQTVQNYYHYFH